MVRPAKTRITARYGNETWSSDIVALLQSSSDMKLGRSKMYAVMYKDDAGRGNK